MEVVTSPLKGVERLSEELRVERAKANAAVQERARLKIEVETLKQALESERSARHSAQQDNAALHTQSERLQQALAEAERTHTEQAQRLAESVRERDELRALLREDESRIDSLTQALSRQEETHAQALLTHETDAKKLLAKDELIAHLKEEVLLLREAHARWEDEKLSTFETLHTHLSHNETLRTQLQVADARETGYQQTRASYEELRRELDESLSLNAALNETTRELNERLAEKTSRERELCEHIEALTSERDEYSRIIGDLDHHVDELTTQLNTERDTRSALQEKADIAVQNRSFLDDQLQSLRTQYEEAQEELREMSAHGLQQEQQRQALENEKNALLSRCQELEALCERGKSAQAMAAEVESLRAQLQQVRKRVIQRDLEEEAGVMAPQAILEREQQGRQVYESIIRDLRLEIDRLTHKQHELMFKYDEAQSRAARVDALEDELRMYEEMVQHLSAESQTVALTASEVADRQAKTTHERQNLQQQLFQRESELESARGENNRLQEELQTVREKLKTFHSQRLAADKRATELLATNAKLEATLEDFKQQYDKLVLEQEKAKRLTYTHSDALTQLRTAQSECLSLRNERDELLRRVNEVRTLTQSGEREQQITIESLSQRVTELTNENTNLSQRIHTLSQRVEHSEAENARLRKENESLVTERDHLQHTLAIQESAHTTQQLNTLQNELSQTMNEWQAMEEEKKAKETVLSQLTVEYNREKERNVLLKMQMDLLEERVKVLSEELSIFRKIDVYHTTRQRELEFHSSTVREKEREKLKEKESASVKAITTTTTTMTAISPRKLGEKKTFSSLSLTHKPTQPPSKFGLYTPHSTYTQPTQHTDTDSLSFSPSASPRMTPSQSPRTTQTQLTSSDRLGGRLSLEDILAPTHTNTRNHTTNTTTTTQHTHAHTRHHTHTRAAPQPPQLLPQTQTLTQHDQDAPTSRERDGGENEEETRESVEEKRRESERMKEAERDKERERTLSERATRKAQREEQLRQMVLSQEKQRLSQTLPAHTPHTHASHTHMTQNPLATRTAVVTTNSGVATGSSLSQSSAISRSSSVDRNDLTTPQTTSLLSSRRHTDMERARRLLSM